MRKGFLFILFTIFVCSSLFAKDTVRLVERSQSGRLLRLNMGKSSLESQEVALLVMLTKQKTAYIKHPYRYLPVAKVQLVKAGERNSLWYADIKKLSSKSLKVGASYLLLRKSDFLKNRAPNEIAQRTVVTADGRSLSDEEVLFRQDRKEELRNIKLRTNAWKRREKYEVIDLAKWRESRESEPWINPGYESVIAGKIIRHSKDVDLPGSLDLETYEKMLVSYLKKINDPSLTWEERYAMEQKAIEDKKNPEFVYGLNQKLVDKQADERIALQKKMEGAGWSQNYSKDEMRAWIEKHGAISEIETRDEVDRHSLQGGYHVSMGINLIDNELVSDFENTRGFKVNLEGAFEWFAFRTTDTWLRNVSLEFSARYALDGIATGAANALSAEVSFATRLLWYPISPYRMNKNIYFVGVGARLGVAGLTVARTSEEGSYSLIGLGINGGYRYNFLNGWGLRILASIEPLLLQSATRSEPVVHLQDSLNITDFRVQVGLSYVY